MISMLTRLKNNRERKEYERSLRNQIYRQIDAEVAQMTNDEKKQYSHRCALEEMYNKGKAILSPRTYSQKQSTFTWFGFTMGLFAVPVIARYFGIGIVEWIAYPLMLVSGIFCALLFTLVFETNFVCDESL